MNTYQNESIFDSIRRISEAMQRQQSYAWANAQNRAAYTECPRYQQVVDPNPPIPPGTIDLTFEEIREN